MTRSHFDDAAATWDDEPRRIALMKAVGQAILHEARPTKDMTVLDYGCGTGLVSLFLLPHVRSVTGADNSLGMLEVLRKKVADADVKSMDVVQLDLEHDPPPAVRFDMIVTSMTLHHVANTDRVLRAFYELLRPSGTVCIADLDTEPGIFHTPEAAPSVRHHGFDRGDLKKHLESIGFRNLRDVTAHTMHKVVADGSKQAFPIFLIIADRQS